MGNSLNCVSTNKSGSKPGKGVDNKKSQTTASLHDTAFTPVSFQADGGKKVNLTQEDEILQESTRTPGKNGLINTREQREEAIYAKE